MTYDFSQLNGNEFEQLAVDLLGKYLDVRIERFKPGKDKGVDGRYFSSQNGECIIQCKHFLKSGLPSLISKIKSEEKDKLIALNPNRYFFITSLRLSRENKKTIKQLFSPYIHREDDIYGQEDLNDLLSRNPHIEEKYFKLWISSTAVMQRVLNNGIVSRSNDLLMDFIEKGVKYAYTTNHKNAIKQLNEKWVLIITGEPGIGKTTLAENVSLYFCSLGYEFIDIQESLSEAENRWISDKKQLFYYDDFLGSNYFEAIENKKDAHIISFINRIAKNKNKLFILTSRTTILNTGIHHSSSFNQANIQKNEYILEINKLSQYEKGLILYNQMWHSQLDQSYTDEIYKDKRYKTLVDHKNFNPRLMEFILDNERVNIPATEYWQHICQSLENPYDIWDHCFKRQTNPYSRNLVLLTVFNGGNISENRLRQAFNILIKLDPISNYSHTEKDFNSVVQLVTRSFLNRVKDKEAIYFTVLNPSLTDFVLHNYLSDTDRLIKMYKALGTLESIEHLVALKESNLLAKFTAHQILEHLFSFDLPPINGQHELDDYLIFLAAHIEKNDNAIAKIDRIVERIIRTPSPIKHYQCFWCLLVLSLKEIALEDYSFLKILTSKKVLDRTSLMALLHHYRTVCPQNESLKEIIVGEIDAYLHYHVDDIANELDLDDFLVRCDYRDESCLDINRKAVVDSIADKLADSIADFELEEEFEELIDFQDIASAVDIDDLVSQHLSDSDYDYEGGSGVTYLDTAQSLESLFERS